jgi:hypothetical protein
MIRYSLLCEAAHAFESWFRDSSAFELQVKTGGLECPVCGSKRIGKQIMAPAVTLREEAPARPQSVAMSGDKDSEMRAMLRAFRHHLETHFENVGTEFADEARKIHHGESDERPIYGVTTPDEAKALHEEGIEVMPLPPMPDDLN